MNNAQLWTMQDVIRELEKRYPLLQNLSLAAYSSAPNEHFPGLISLLLSVAENMDEERSCCFIMPEIDTVAPLTAVSLALVSLRRDFDTFTRNYAENGLKRGQRVRVLPKGHVYVFDGVFSDTPHFSGGNYFRLRVLDENAWCSVPIYQVLRLDPTTRKRPKGKLPPNLGKPVQSDLDKLLGIQSWGNESLYKNRVIFLSGRSYFEQFIDSVYVSRIGNTNRNRLGDILPWGTLDEQGKFVYADPYHVTGEPLIAVTHSPEYLAKACRRLRDDSRRQPIVIVEGTRRLVHHYQAFDEVADFNRLLIVADESSQEDLTNLEDRGCTIWKASNDEILLGEKKTSIFFGRVFKAANNRQRLKLETIACSGDRLDLVADGLILASDRVNELEGLEETKRSIRHLFGLLFRVAERICPFYHQERDEILKQLRSVQARLARQVMWVPRDAMELLVDTCTYLKEVILDQNHGQAKGDALIRFLDARAFAASEVLLVTRYQESCDVVRDWCIERGLNVQVSSDRLIYENQNYEQIILLSWLNTSRFRKLLQRYVAPNLALLAYPFEASWLKQFRARLRRESKQNRPSDNERATLLGVDEAALHDSMDKEDGIADGELNDGGGLPASLSLFGIEERIIYRRKGGGVREIDGDDTTEAYYVSFLGNTYAYVTSSYHLPVITSLVQHPESSLSTVPQCTLSDLEPGDFVLFRDGSNRDVIQLFAEVLMGSERYRETWDRATSWRSSLRLAGGTAKNVHRLLRSHGLDRSYGTVCNWLYNEDLIGPQESEDLQTIEKAAGPFTNPWQEIWKAIETIRSYHTSAGSKVSEWLLREVPEKLDRLVDGETKLDLDFGRFWIVEIEEIAERPDKFPLSQTNRLLWDND